MPKGSAPAATASAAITAAIRERMKQNGVTQTQLAADAHMSQQHLSRILADRFTLRVDQFIAICEVLELDTGSVMGDAVQASHRDAGSSLIIGHAYRIRAERDAAAGPRPEGNASQV